MNPVQELEEDALIRLLPDLRGKAVLDVGCGTGRVSRIVLARGAASTVGIDTSHAMLEEARSQSGDASSWLVADACALPWDAPLFDVVICTLVLGHVERLEDALAEMDRVLKAGGTVLFSGFHPFATLRGWNRSFMDPSSGQTYSIAHHVHLFEDYFHFFLEHCWSLEAFEEPRFETYPIVFVLRARKGDRESADGIHRDSAKPCKERNGLGIGQPGLRREVKE